MLTVTNSATGRQMQVSAANMSVAFSLGGDLWYSGWDGDLLNTYQSFYSYWKEYYFMRNLYMNVRLPVAQNPCKLYANWFTDNVINLGVNIRNVGVIEYASPSVAGLNPLGLAYPQVGGLVGLGGMGGRERRGRGPGKEGGRGKRGLTPRVTGIPADVFLNQECLRGRVGADN
jgi:hypothetical protein